MSASNLYRFLPALLWVLINSPLLGQEARLPEPLRVWKEWVLWDGSPHDLPHPYNDPNTSLPAWPSTLTIDVTANTATWSMSVQTFRKTWLQLPGDSESWPRNVRASTPVNTPSTTDDNVTSSTLIDVPLVVLPRNGIPSVELDKGSYTITGEFQWTVTASKVAIPKTIGIVELKLEGSDVPFPNWDANGSLWLSRQQNETAEQNRMSVKVYRYLEDGIPSWLHTTIELTVSGKSREEDLGHLLPEGWTLAKVDSLVPLAIDEQGRAKVQVRPGNWLLTVMAFRVAPLAEFRFATGTTPAVDVELIGLKVQPQFRMIEFEGLQSIDVQQTTFPENWRSMPVFQWTVNAPFRIVEKMRGMGTQNPSGFTVQREFWLDDDGQGLIYQDTLHGRLQESWRLDSAPDHQLGAVRIDQERQLITANPLNGTPGVEVRSRNPNVVALGRIEKSTQIPATGWAADVDNLSLAISLPPGWRLWAVLGADNVSGDWITAWTLMDIFLLLIFALAIYRLYGIPAGVLALVALGLSYHEPASPRWTWLMLLIPLALVRVLPDGTGRKLVQLFLWSAFGLLLLYLVPFLAKQIEFAIYPQLEIAQSQYGDRSTWFWNANQYRQSDVGIAQPPSFERQSFDSAIPNSDWQVNAPSSQVPQQEAISKGSSKATSNLMIDPAARTQTGPALPKWRGNTVFCSWDGPVSSDQTIHPIYLSRDFHRLLAIARSILLLLLLGVLCNLIGRRRKLAIPPQAMTNPPAPITAALLAMIMFAGNASYLQAQIPSPEMLEQLKSRLSEPASAFPNAADIAALDLSIQDNRLTMKLEIHAAQAVAVPIPGKFPAWSPRTVRWDEPAPSDGSPITPPLVSRSEDGTLWLLTRKGVQKVIVEGLLSDNNEWVLGFPVTPRSIVVNAPQWQVVGLQGNQAPGNQLFFTRVEKGNEQVAKFDQRIFRPVIQVERRIEIGLIWKVYTTVTRLSPTGKAISLNIPLLSDERVVSSSLDRTDRLVEVNLAPEQSSYSWESELPISNQIVLQAAASDQYVERWVLESSAVWNIEMSGVAPLYESSNADLLPVWQVWPGEQVTLNIKRPEAIPGEVLTVQNVERTIALGARQRTTNLNLDVESSLGGEFRLQMSAEDEVNSLKINQRPQPIRRDGNNLIISLEPGVQKIQIAMESNEILGFQARAAAVTLPVPSANILTEINVPSNRWILWANGPLRGPAVRLWIFLASAIVFAFVLSWRGKSPLQSYEWLLLAIGLTQLHAVFGLIVVGWLYLLQWRSSQTNQAMSAWGFNLLQLGITLLTVVTLFIFVAVVGKGLLGAPEMFITGNGSYQGSLRWFEPQSGVDLSQPFVISVSLWYYRLFMLLWALWLASALLRWLVNGWTAFSHGGRWHFGKPKIVEAQSGLVSD